MKITPSFFICMTEAVALQAREMEWPRDLHEEFENYFIPNWNRIFEEGLDSLDIPSHICCCIRMSLQKLMDTVAHTAQDIETGIMSLPSLEYEGMGRVETSGYHENAVDLLRSMTKSILQTDRRSRRKNVNLDQRKIPFGERFFLMLSQVTDEMIGNIFKDYCFVMEYMGGEQFRQLMLYGFDEEQIFEAAKNQTPLPLSPELFQQLYDGGLRGFQNIEFVGISDEQSNLIAAEETLFQGCTFQGDFFKEPNQCRFQDCVFKGEMQISFQSCIFIGPTFTEKFSCTNMRNASFVRENDGEETKDARVMDLVVLGEFSGNYKKNTFVGGQIGTLPKGTNVQRTLRMNVDECRGSIGQFDHGTIKNVSGAIIGNSGGGIFEKVEGTKFTGSLSECIFGDVAKSFFGQRNKEGIKKISETTFQNTEGCVFYFRTFFEGVSFQKLHNPVFHIPDEKKERQNGNRTITGIIAVEDLLFLTHEKFSEPVIFSGMRVGRLSGNFSGTLLQCSVGTLEGRVYGLDGSPVDCLEGEVHNFNYKPRVDNNIEIKTLTSTGTVVLYFDPNDHEKSLNPDDFFGLSDEPAVIKNWEEGGRVGIHNIETGRIVYYKSLAEYKKSKETRVPDPATNDVSSAESGHEVIELKPVGES